MTATGLKPAEVTLTMLSGIKWVFCGWQHAMLLSKHAALTLFPSRSTRPTGSCISTTQNGPVAPLATCNAGTWTVVGGCLARE